MRYTYSTKVRPFRDDPTEYDFEWYFCDEGAEIYPHPTCFGSSVYRDKSDLLGAGEVASAPKKRTSGKNIWNYPGKTVIGTPDDFLHGLPVAAMDRPPPPFCPLCAGVQSDICFCVASHHLTSVAIEGAFSAGAEITESHCVGDGLCRIAVYIGNENAICDDDFNVYLNGNLLGQTIETDTFCGPTTCRGTLFLPASMSGLTVPTIVGSGGMFPICLGQPISLRYVYSTYLDYVHGDSFLRVVTAVSNGCGNLGVVEVFRATNELGTINLCHRVLNDIYNEAGDLNAIYTVPSTCGPDLTVGDFSFGGELTGNYARDVTITGSFSADGDITGEYDTLAVPIHGNFSGDGTLIRGVHLSRFVTGSFSASAFFRPITFIRGEFSGGGELPYNFETHRDEDITGEFSSGGSCSLVNVNKDIAGEFSEGGSIVILP